MIKNDEQELKLRLSTLDCNTSTKYYQVTQTLNDKQKSKIKSYFRYYTPDNFVNLDNVAGNTTGWMCKSDDVEEVEKLLGITETIQKQKTNLDKIQRKTTDSVLSSLNKYSLSFSK
jgi:hypothetical protein